MPILFTATTETVTSLSISYKQSVGKLLVGVLRELSSVTRAVKAEDSTKTTIAVASDLFVGKRRGS
jgi:hypothetical protein